MKAVVVLAGLAACFPQRDVPLNRPVNVPAPSVLHSRYLQVGQWAHYEERGPAGKLGDLWLAAIGNADCGTWVAAAIEGNGGSRKWILCVDEDQAGYRITRAQVDIGDGHAHAIDLEHAGAYAGELAVLQTRVLPPVLTGAFAREDIAVPAGRFAGTLVATEAGHHTWFHPNVPFGGAVKLADGGGTEDVLVGFGDVGDDVEKEFTREARAGNEAHRRWFALDVGTAWTAKTEGTDARWSPGALSVTMGFATGRTLDFVAHFTGARDSAHLGHAGIGLRWLPLARRALYLQSTVGYADLRSGMSDPIDQGVGFANSLGWLFPTRRDWSFGVALQHQVAYLTEARTWTQGVTAGFTVQLDW